MDDEQDETIIVSRTKPVIEEATVVTSSIHSVEEATITNPSAEHFDLTSTGDISYETYEPVVEEAPVAEAEVTIEREVGQVFEAPAVVPTKAMPLPVVTTDTKFNYEPEVVSKSKPNSDAAKLLKKNLSRTKRNSVTVIVAVVFGSLLIGVTLAILWALFT